MAKVFIEERNGQYVALQNKLVIATGPTQAATGALAHALRPDDTIQAERVRNTSVGRRDEWRDLYKPRK